MTIYSTLYDGAKPFSDTAVQINLAAATVLTYTVPGLATQRYRCQFSFPASASVYVGYNVTPAASTTGTITSSPNIEFNPKEAKFVRGGDVIKFFSTAAVTDGGLSLLELPIA